MSDRSEATSLLKVGIIAAFATLAFVGTTVIRVPIPATGGYFNLGDTFVMTAGMLYGPAVGALVGMIGPTLADAVGYPQFILATAIVKFCEGGAVGLINKNSDSTRSNIRPILALIAGTIILVSGYFLFEAFIYPLIGQTIPYFKVTDLNAAILEILPNLIQGTVSAVIAFGIYWVLKRNW